MMPQRHHFLVYWTAQSWIYSRTKSATQKPSINWDISFGRAARKDTANIFAARSFNVYNVSRAWVGIFDEYVTKNVFVYDNKQRLSRSLRVAKSKWGW